MIRVPNKIITKQEAWERGLTWYFTGKPCKRGHLSTRNFNSAGCHACAREARKLGKRETSKTEFHTQWLKEFRARRQQRRMIDDMLS